MGVSHLIDKLFGGDGGRNEALLRAYGKLPFYAEYRRLEVSPGTPTVFSQWLDQGRLAWVRSPSRSEHGVTRPSRMLIGLPDAKEAVIASVWDSRDSLGRVFPFAFFVTCAPDALGADAVERLVTVGNVSHEFDRLYTQLHTLAAGGDFYRRFQKQKITLKPEDLAEQARGLREQAARIAADAWLKGLSRGKDRSAEEWFGGLLRRVERWKDEAASTHDLAISCPVLSGLSPAAQSVLWLEWLGGLFKRSGRLPWMLQSLEPEQQNGDLTLLLRNPLPDDYQLLTTDAHAYAFVEHLTALTSAPATTAPAPATNIQPTDSVLSWLKQHAP